MLSEAGFVTHTRLREGLQTGVVFITRQGRDFAKSNKRETLSQTGRQGGLPGSGSQLLHGEDLL